MEGANNQDFNEINSNVWHTISQSALRIVSDKERSAILDITVPKLNKEQLLAFYKEAFELSWSQNNVKLLKEVEVFKKVNNYIDLNEFHSIIVDSLVYEYENGFHKESEGHLSFYKELEYFNIDYIKEIDNSKWTANAQHCKSLLEVVLFNNYSTILKSSHLAQRTRSSNKKDNYLSNALLYILDKQLIDNNIISQPVLDRSALFVSKNISQILFSSIFKNNHPLHNFSAANNSLFELFELLNKLFKKGANLEQENSIGRALISSKKEDGRATKQIGNVNKIAIKLLLPVYCWLLMSEDNQFKKKSLYLDVFQELKKHIQNLPAQEVSRIFLFCFNVELKKENSLLDKSDNIKSAFKIFIPQELKAKAPEFWNFNWFDPPSQIYLNNDPQSIDFAKIANPEKKPISTPNTQTQHSSSNMKFVQTGLSKPFKSLFENIDFSSFNELQMRQFFNQSADKIWNWNFKNIFCSYQSIDISARSNSLKAATIFQQQSISEQLHLIAGHLAHHCPAIKDDCLQLEHHIAQIFENTIFSKETIGFKQKLTLCHEQASLYIKTSEAMILNDKPSHCTKKAKAI